MSGVGCFARLEGDVPVNANHDFVYSRESVLENYGDQLGTLIVAALVLVAIQRLDKGLTRGVAKFRVAGMQSVVADTWWK